MIKTKKYNINEPVFKCKECKFIWTNPKKPIICPKCESKKIKEI